MALETKHKSQTIKKDHKIEVFISYIFDYSCTSIKQLWKSQPYIPHFNYIHKYKLTLCSCSKWNDDIKSGLQNAVIVLILIVIGWYDY